MHKIKLTKDTLDAIAETPLGPKSMEIALTLKDPDIRALASNDPKKSARAARKLAKRCFK